MPPVVVIGLFESETHRAVARVLADWSRNELIRDFILCWTTPDVRFERVSAGEMQATRLASELDVGEEIVLVNVGAWTADEAEGLVSQLEASIAARATVLNILAWTQSAVREPIVLLAPPTLDTRIPLDCIREGRRTLVLSPEEREAPGGTNHMIESPEALHAHIAAALVSLTGLWSGTENLSIPLLSPDPHATNGAIARAVTAYTRIVDIGYLADHVAKHTLRTLSGWPNPSPADFDSVERDDVLLADLTSRYLTTYREVLGPTTIEPLEVEEEPPPGLLERWRRFLRELWETIKLKPVEIAENLLRSGYNKAASLTERLTGGSVNRWDDSESTFEALQSATEERYRTADGAVRDAWWDLRRLCIGMIDGSDLPTFVPIKRVTEADRRLLILDPKGYVPDPNVPSPVMGIAPCDPRKLDPDCGVDLSGHDPAVRSEIEAFVDQRKSSVVWKVGVALANRITAASSEVTEAKEAVTGLREHAAEELKRSEKRAKRLAKGGRRFLLTSLVLALAGIAAAIAVATTQRPIITAISCIGIPVVWFVIVLILAIRLVHRRRKFADQTTKTILELSNQTVRIGIRRADVDRLNRRYDEYLDWADLLGWLLHAPWAPPAELDWRPVIDRELTLPASVQRVVGWIEPKTLALLEGSSRAAVFPPSWLDQVASAQQEYSARDYLAVRENNADPERTGRALPDPYGDTRIGDGTARKFFSSAVRSRERRRELGEQAVGRIEDDLRKRWAVNRIVSAVMPGHIDNEITALAPGWSAEPPKLQALAARMRPSIVRIRRDDFGGSGVVIGPGRVLTNAHVVGYKEGTVDLFLDGNWQPIDGTVEKVSSATDLALVRFVEPASAVPAVPLAAERPTQGASVLTLGYPLLLDGDPTLSWGYVSAQHRSITVDRGDGNSWRLDVLQCSYASAGGASGSGVLDATGHLVGVHCAGRVRDESADDFMSFAVPVDDIRDFLDESGEPVQSEILPSPTSDPAKETHESLAAFLAEVAVAVGDPIFGRSGPWRAGKAPTEAELVFGSDDLDPGIAKLDARRGAFSVFVRSVTVLSAARNAADLDA